MAPINSRILNRLVAFIHCILNRLTGFPIVAVHYRADWRILVDAHPLILALIEDSADGENARRTSEIWLRQSARNFAKTEEQSDAI